MKRWIIVLVVCGLLCLLGCQQTQTQAPISRSGFALDTAVSITVYETSEERAETALSLCFEELKRLEQLLSVTNQASDIYRLNHAGGQPVAIAKETEEVLRLSQSVSVASNGAFDVTIRPVVSLWDFSADSPVIPDAEKLKQAVQQVDYHHLTVESGSATLSMGEVDLGGVAKGYIADCLRTLLEEQGITSALIDLGGNIVACGSKQGEAWRIGIKNPQSTDTLCAVVTGTDLAVVTSGTYERGFTVNGVRYHHILHPQTGMPVQNTLASVTVVCQNSALADALSTACFVLGESEALTLLSAYEEVEALFVRQDGTRYATSGLSYAVSD